MQGAADRTNRVAYGAIKHATHGATCRADNAAHQATDAQRAVLRCRGRLAGQLQIAVGHDFLAIRRLHAHFAGNTGIEGCGDRTIVGLARQLLLGRQRDRCRRLDLSLTVDLVARQLELRIHLAVNRRLEAGQRASGRAGNSDSRLGTGIDRGHLGTGDANPRLRLRIRSHTKRPVRRRCNVGRQRCINLRHIGRCMTQPDIGPDIGRQRRNGDLLRRGVRIQLHLHRRRQHVAHHRQRVRTQLQADTRISADCRCALRLTRGGRQCHFSINLDRHRLRVLGRERLQVTQGLIGFGRSCMPAGQRTQQGQGQGGGHQQGTARITGSAAAAVAGGQFRGHNQSIELAVPYTPVDAVHEHFPRRRTT